MSGFSNPLTPVTNAVEHNTLARILANKVGALLHSTPVERGGTIATGGLYNFEHPDQSRAYWTDILKSLNPTTAKGAIALMATLFGPKMGEDPAIGVRGPGGLPVPRVEVSRPMQDATSDPGRNELIDYAGPLAKRALLAREGIMRGTVGAHFRNIHPQDEDPAGLVQHYAHTVTETLHQGHESAVDTPQPPPPKRGPQPLSPVRSLQGTTAVKVTPQQAALLQQMLAHRLA